MRAPRVGDFVTYTDRGRRRIARVESTPLRGYRTLWCAPRLYGAWEPRLLVEVPTDALMRVVSPFDPPVRVRTPLEMFHDAEDHQARYLARSGRGREALQQIVAKGLTFKKPSCK